MGSYDGRPIDELRNHINQLENRVEELETICDNLEAAIKYLSNSLGEI